MGLSRQEISDIRAASDDYLDYVIDAPDGIFGEEYREECRWQLGERMLAEDL